VTALVALACLTACSSGIPLKAPHRIPTSASRSSSSPPHTDAIPPPTTAECEQNDHVACYGATQIEQAYGLPTLYRQGIEGQGQTIVIVDSFGSPDIKANLSVFDQTFGLPDPPSFKVIQPAGGYTWTGTNDQQSWAFETSLDVEYAHAIAPKANILLVETPVAETEGVTGFPQIVEAEQYVIDHGLGGVISQSFSATEETFPSSQAITGLRQAYLNAYRHHVTVLAATGDDGATNLKSDSVSIYTHQVVGWPSTDPLVTAVGGTQLSLNAAGDRISPDVAWSDSGGGRSQVFARPWYQAGVMSQVGGWRGIPDISMSGSCAGSVDVYLSLPGTAGNWSRGCGTSESSPMFAGIVALADQVAHHWLGLVNPALYRLSAQHAPGIVDVTSGSNSYTVQQGGTSTTVQGFNAAPGYDLVSGVGTVYAPDFVEELAQAAS
jgi:subtilase family serine protease